MKTNKLEQAARELRIATLKSIYEAKTGHIGSSFSIIEFLQRTEFVKQYTHCALQSLVTSKKIFLIII